MEQRIFVFNQEYRNMIQSGCIVSTDKRITRATRKKLRDHAIKSYNDLRIAYDLSILAKNDENKPIFIERRYHTFSHVLDCIDILKRSVEILRLDKEEFQKLFMAISWHDSVYKTYDNNRETSEELSAYRFKHNFDSNLFDFRFLNSVKALIIKTDHFKTSSDGGYLNGIIRDIDLHGLGGTWGRFRENSQLIRMEYHNFPDHEFIPGRISFCESMLKRNHIYEITLLREVFEERARENLERELERLEKQMKEINDPHKN